MPIDVNPATQTECAKVLEAFMQFPAPLALVDSKGAIMLASTAWSARFGTAGLALDGPLDGGSRAGRNFRVTFQSTEDSEGAPAQLRAIRISERIFLVIDDSYGLAQPEEVDVLRRRVSDLERLASTDHLTGAWNRAHFEHLIEAELARSTAAQQPVSLVLLDIDHFKQVNDTYGHAIGDSVLRELVRLVQSNIRASDFLFRWGGEEFAVLVTSAGYRVSERLAENLRRVVAQNPFAHVGKVTISLGVAEHLGSEDPQSWFRRLDGALYEAKAGGRNRVTVDRRGNSDQWALGAESSVLHLAWQEAFESGNEAIDDEHRELFVLANRLIDAASRGDTQPAALRSALETLLEHVQRHFAHEEEILAGHHYPDLEQHKRAHSGLLRRAGYLKGLVDTGDASLGSVVEFLAQDVVAHHLMTVDRAFFPLFAKASVAATISPD